MSECVYCGNNQAVHQVEWIDTSLTALSDDVMKYAGPGIRVRNFLNSSRALGWSIGMFSLFGAVSYVDDIPRLLSSRAKVLWEEAKRRGITVRMVKLFGKPSETFEVTVAGRKIIFTGLPRPFKSSPWDRGLDDKAIVKENLSAAGIAVSRGGRARTFAQARDLFHSIQKPVVVKPRIGSRGRHTTTHVTNEEELRDAFRRAKQMCYWVIVEEHLSGSVYRSTLVDLISEGILRGDPPRVTGDGIHSVGELVALKNTSRHPRVAAVVLSSAHYEHLARVDIAPTAVLEKGKTIDLTEKIGIAYGGLSADDTDRMHPETKRILEKAARALGDPLIGLDFIIPDITAAPDKQQWGIIECNAVPFIDLHHDPVEGKTRNVAGAVWDYVERYIDEF